MLRALRRSHLLDFSAETCKSTDSFASDFAVPSPPWCEMTVDVVGVQNDDRARGVVSRADVAAVVKIDAANAKSQAARVTGFIRLSLLVSQVAVAVHLPVREYR